MIILIDGLPGCGKSTILRNLINKVDYVCVYEFHTKRKIITKEYGFSDSRNSNSKKLEDKLEQLILKNRFIDNNKEFEKIKLELLKEKINELNSGEEIIQEGFFSCLIDKCSEEFLEEVRKIIESRIDKILFLNVDEIKINERQKSRILAREGVYDDKTDKERNNIFLKQFNEITKNIKNKVFYINGNKDINGIIKEVISLI